eukprot:3866304-Prymnesium_polylepis.1
MQISANVNVTLWSCTITNAAAAAGGGGALASTGNLTLRNTTITNCTARTGSGIFLFDSGSMSMSFSKIFNSSASDEGGALTLYYRAAATITSSTISGTNARWRGGVLRIFSPGGGAFMSMVSSTITNVLAKYGGAIHNDHGQLVVSGCSMRHSKSWFDDEENNGSGGVLINDEGMITIDSSLIADSFANQDGGMMVLENECIVTVVNSQILRSHCHGQGGVALISSSNSTLTFEGTLIVNASTSAQHARWAAGRGGVVSQCHGLLKLIHCTIFGASAANGG